MTVFPAMKTCKKTFTAFFLSFLLCPAFSAESSGQKIIKIDTQKLPLIESPDSSKNYVFRQFLEEAELNCRKFSPQEKNKNRVLSFYRIKVPENMDFIWFSSRVSPVYKDTIATINTLTSADAKISGQTLIVPSFNGLFIPEEPASLWEQLLHSKYVKEEGTEKSREQETFVIDGKIFYFFPEERFDSTTSLYFLDTNLVSPLLDSVLTSSYGYRISPISGKWKFHSGIDLAAPEKSSVFACSTGEVSRTDFNPTYGNFIIISHYSGLTSLYAHLSEILVKEGQAVKTGQLIAKSGSTGASTRPHLHFELRKNGNPTDPDSMIKF